MAGVAYVKVLRDWKDTHKNGDHITKCRIQVEFIPFSEIQFPWRNQCRYDRVQKQGKDGKRNKRFPQKFSFLVQGGH